MSKRESKKNDGPAAPELPVQAAPPPPVEAPLQEYEYQGVVWRVGRFDLLQGEIENIESIHLPAFHGLAAMRQRGWLIVRRLFGLRPAVMSMKDDPEDMRIWSRPELMEFLGLSRLEMASELDEIRGSWRALRASIDKEAAETATPVPARAAIPVGETGDLGIKDDDVEFRTQLSAVGLAPRFQDMNEREWFRGRFAIFEKVFKVPMAVDLAGNALMTVLRIRRMDAEENRRAIAQPSWTGSKDWADFMKLRQQLLSDQQDQMERLNKLISWAGLESGKMTFQNTVSEITRAIQEYHATGDTKLIDGIRTLTEVMTEVRTSEQAPEPRYRAGQALFLAMAKQGFWDPNWKCPVADAVFGRFDRTWRESFMEKQVAAGVKPTDLMVDGPEGQYPDLPVITPEQQAKN